MLVFGGVFGVLFSWNLKHPFISGCFNWMIPILYIGNGCFTKHPIKNGCLEYQVLVKFRNDDSGNLRTSRLSSRERFFMLPEAGFLRMRVEICNH